MRLTLVHGIMERMNMFEILSPSSTMKFMFLLLMIVVAAIDWDRMIIPNPLMVAGLLLGAAFHVDADIHGFPHALLAGAWAFGLMFFIRSAGSRFLRKEAMGFGDVKLAAVVALFIGFQGFLVALWGAASAGAIHGMISPFRIRSPRSRPGWEPPEKRVPFGSYFGVCSALVLIFEEPIQALVSPWWMLMP